MAPDRDPPRFRVLNVPPGDRRQLAAAAGWFFCVLAGYYAIRPLREAFASSFSPEDRTRAFASTLTGVIVAAPLYAALVAAIPRRLLAPLAYSFFAVTLLVFRAAFAAPSHVSPTWLRWMFFIWVSVFNLYAVTVFWSNAVALFTGEQGKRLFGLVAAAGTLGSIVGSQLHKALAVAGRQYESLLLSAALFMAILPCAAALRRWSPADDELTSPTSNRTETTLLTIFGGAADLLRSPYLAGLGLLIALPSVCATAVYLQLLDAVREAYPQQADRSAWFADLNTYQSGLTLAGQALGASWLMRFAGVGVTLAVAPVVYMVGFTALGLGYASLRVLAVFDMAQRFAGFAFGVPAREVLFTAVTPEEKYRAKAFADTVLKRVGDSGAAYGFEVLAKSRLPAAAATWAMIPLAGVLVALSLALGRAQQHRAGRHIAPKE